MTDDLAFESAYQISQLIVEKQVSPVEIVEMFLNRISSFDVKLNSYITVAYDEALRDAKNAESAVLRGAEIGPLHGVPISVKDLELTKGIRTTSGSLVFRDRIPDADSIVVQRIKESGAIIIGKTNTPEFGYLGTTENLIGDPCENPWKAGYTSGGSSGGAATALASGLCTLSQGSDGGGSIRIPSNFCGVYGIKPTLGRIPLYKSRDAEFVQNQLSQPGPMTRTVLDSALLLQVLSGPDPIDPGALRSPPPDFVAATAADVSGIRVGWSSDYGYAPVDPGVIKVTSKAAQIFEELGCVVDTVNFSVGEPFDAFWNIFCASGFARYGYLLDTVTDSLTDYFRAGLEHGRDVTGSVYSKAMGEIDQLKYTFEDIFEKYDLLLSPVTSVPSFPVGEKPSQINGKEVHSWWGFFPFTYPINMIGCPAASVPCGFSSEGMPIGLHIVGRRGEEATVLAASAAFEKAKPWSGYLPTLA
tara:strand:+ start:2426 stop:3844 length:1419 start_codon:yes stop_codon:yes gene_type:complete